MICLYDIVLWFYRLAIYCIAPFNYKARLWIKGRKKILQRIRQAIPPSTSLIWIHCSSLGEFEQGRPLIEEIKRKYPQFKILLTFFSPSGYEIRKNYPIADWVFYLPPDTSYNANKFIEICRPQKIFFVKYDFWYHYIYVANKNKIPIYLISGIFRNDQIFFKFYGSWYRKVLGLFKHLFVQDQLSEQLLQLNGIKNVSVAGDTRFDRVYAISRQATGNTIVEQFSGSYKTLIAGSTWEKDEILLSEYINNCKDNDYRFIFAPHEIDQAHILRLQSMLLLPSVRFSRIDGFVPPDVRVLIIDTMGMLASVYRYGTIAYVGGGFGSGIHNTLEPAVFGLPVIFGPVYHKFNEAIALLNLNAGFTVSTFEELANILNRLFTDDRFRINCAERAAQYTFSMTGATEKILSATFS